MAKRKTIAGLEAELAESQRKFNLSNSCCKRLYGEISDLKRELATLSGCLVYRNKIRDEVDWPSIERMLSQFGFRRDQPVSLKVAITTIVRKLYEVERAVGLLK